MTYTTIRLVHWLIAALMLSTACVAASAAAAPSLAGLSLQTIDKPHAQVELAQKVAIVVIVVFENECHYCLTMMRTVQRVADARGWAPVAVGVGPSRQALSDWAKRANVRMPVVHADKRFLARIGGVKVTPLTLVVDTCGNIRRRIVGSVDDAMLEYRESLAKLADATELSAIDESKIDCAGVATEAMTHVLK